MVSPPAFDSAFNAAFGHLPPGDILLETSAGMGPIATVPYADKAEHIPLQEYPTLPRVYPEFHPTDARAVEVFLSPNHVNLITNSALRHNAAEWSFQGAPGRLVSDSWIGQGMKIENKSKVTHTPIYIGPLKESSSSPGWISTGRGGGEYTFSVYAKGVDSRIQLTLHGYRPVDFAADVPVMEANPSATVHSPYITVSDEDWERHYVKTTARMADISGGTSDFNGCWWIVPEVTIVEDDPFDVDVPSVTLSAFMLDASEGPVCDYFDGDMSEPGRDDFIWIYDTPPGTSRRKALFSAYYYERQSRSHWMHKHMYEAVPVNRPVHVYYYNRNNPWDDNGPIPREITSEQHTSSLDGPSLSVRPYAHSVRALP